MSNVYCPHCTVVSTSLGPRVQLCEQHAERDRLAAENEHVKEGEAHGRWAMAVSPFFYIKPDQQDGVVVVVVREERSGRFALDLQWFDHTYRSRNDAQLRMMDFLAQKGIPHKEVV